MTSEVPTRDGLRSPELNLKNKEKGFCVKLAKGCSRKIPEATINLSYINS